MSDEEAAMDQAGDDSELSTGGEMKFPSVGQALSGLEKTNTVLEKLQTAGIFESSAVLEELRDFTQYGAKLNSLYTARMPWIMVNLPGGETKPTDTTFAERTKSNPSTQKEVEAAESNRSTDPSPQRTKMDVC